jgi:gliding motility-associated protein GldM
MLVAFDSKQANEVIINGKSFMPTDGVVKYEQQVSGNGEQTIKGHINVVGKDGTKEVPFDPVTFNVFTGGATISADKMNVLYIGLDNPMSISVPGFPPDRTIASASGAGVSLKKVSGNQYHCIVSTRGEISVNVTVKMDDGTSKSMGSAKFRVRKIPTPQAQLGQITSGSNETVGTIRANAGRVYGSLGEGFAYEDVKYSVLGFNIMVVPKRGEPRPPVQNQGAALTGAAQSLVNGIRSGDKILIFDISAKGPDGNKKLTPVIIDVR